MPTPEPSTPATPITATPVAPDNLSLAEHEAQFGESAASVPDATGDSTTIATAAQDRDVRGQFKSPRHRARSQQAGASDVPRIAELTKKLRDTEAERDALRTAAPARSAVPAEPVQRPIEPARVLPVAEVKAKPKLEEFQDYGEYVEAVTDWKIGDARRQDREESARQHEASRLAISWKERVDAAKAEYADFEQIALLNPTNIPQGSLVDAWILEHKAGAKVLYHLQKHSDELTTLLTLPLFEQVDALSLLAQRLTTRPLAVTTGAAAAAQNLQPVPRPPTPVRTGPMRAGDEPPGDDVSLTAHAKFYGDTRRRA